MKEMKQSQRDLLAGVEEGGAIRRWVTKEESAVHLNPYSMYGVLRILSATEVDAY